MAAIGNTVPTFADAMKEMTPDLQTIRIAEILNQSNGIMNDIPWYEANRIDGHVSAVRASIPDATWRKINQGITPTKATATQIVDTCGMLEAYSEVDAALVEMQPDPGMFRANQAKGILEGMTQQLVSALIYANASTSPEQINGFMPRYSSLSGGTAGNIIDAGGTGSDNASILLVGWGENTVSGRFPRGSKGGLTRTDFGKLIGRKADDSEYIVYKEWFAWKPGLAVHDWRYVVRAANVDVSDLRGSSPANLINTLIRMQELVPDTDTENVKWVLYMPRALRAWLRIQATNKTNVHLGLGEYAGFKGKVPDFLGIPIRALDKMLTTETRIT